MAMFCYDSIESLTRIKDKLDKSERVFFTRFGDNDIMMMSGTNLKGHRLGTKAYGGNKTVFSLTLQTEIQDAFTIRHRDFLKGVSCAWKREEGMREGVHAPFPYNINLEKKIAAFTNDTRFLLPVLFHYLILYKPELFENFVEEYIRPHRKLFIGSTPKNEAEKIIGKIDYYVQVPKTNAYSQINSWYPRIVEIMTEGDIKVVIPTAGQCSRVIQKRLWKLGCNVWSFDMGSLFDAFQTPTRTWLKKEGKKIVDLYG